jgi:hypothetical protein
MADPSWLQERLELAQRDVTWRTRQWATAALHRADLHLRWATTPDRTTARVLERQVLTALRDQDLWNRLR